MKASHVRSNTCYGPEALKVLFKVFDDAWEDIAGNFGGNALAIQAVRLRLANIILDMGCKGSDDPKQIKNSALEKMARDLRTGAS